MHRCVSFCVTGSAMNVHTHKTMLCTVSKWGCHEVIFQLLEPGWFLSVDLSKKKRAGTSVVSANFAVLFEGPQMTFMTLDDLHDLYKVCWTVSQLWTLNSFLQDWIQLHLYRPAPRPCSPNNYGEKSRVLCIVAFMYHKGKWTLSATCFGIRPLRIFFFFSPDQFNLVLFSCLSIWWFAH